MSYLRDLIDKSNPASTAAFLTICVVLTLLICTVGVLVVMWWKPYLGALTALLGTIGSLVGIRVIREALDAKKPPTGEG